MPQLSVIRRYFKTAAEWTNNLIPIDVAVGVYNLHYFVYIIYIYICGFTSIQVFNVLDDVPSI